MSVLESINIWFLDKNMFVKLFTDYVHIWLYADSFTCALAFEACVKKIYVMQGIWVHILV